MIIDGHCHAGRGERLTAPWNTAAPLGRYLRRARVAGIHRTVVFSTFAGNYAVANAEVARIVASAPDRLIGFVCVHPGRDAGGVASMVGEAVQEWGFRGVKVHRLDAPVTREVCEAAAVHGVPLLYDVAGQPELLELAASAYPQVTFVVPHLGSFADDWRAHQRLIDQMRRFPNVLADTSGVRRFDYLLQAVRRLGPGRLVFGSDGPWLHPGLELAKVRLLGLDPAGEARILGGNLCRLLTRTASRVGCRVLEPDPGLTRPPAKCRIRSGAPHTGAGARSRTRSASRPDAAIPAPSMTPSTR